MELYSLYGYNRLAEEERLLNNIHSRCPMICADIIAKGTKFFHLLLHLLLGLLELLHVAASVAGIAASVAASCWCSNQFSSIA